MFRRMGVRKGDGIGERFDEHKRAIIFEHAREMRPAAELCELACDFALHRIEEFRGVGRKNDLAALAVLGLREQVGGDPRGVRARVGENEDFARAGEEVDGHAAKHLPLRLDDVGVAGAENFPHWRDARRAECERRNGLRAAGFVNLRRTREVERVEQRGVH